MSLHSLGNGATMETVKSLRNGPGKFATTLDAWVYDQTLDGCADTISENDCGGASYTFAEFSEGVRVEEGSAEQLPMNVWTFYSAIVYESSDGGVEVTYFDSVEEGRTEYDRIEAEILGEDDETSDDAVGMDETGHELDGDGEQIHRWGDWERAPITGNPHRKCKVIGCKCITLDGDDDEDTVDEVPEECECDNTHEQNDTVCRYCYAKGRRKYNDPEVSDESETWTMPE